MDVSITTSARGAQGPQGPAGPPGSSDATSLRGIALDPTVGSPTNGAMVGFNASTGKWVAYTSVDVGTF